MLCSESMTNVLRYGVDYILRICKNHVNIIPLSNLFYYVFLENDDVNKFL